MTNPSEILFQPFRIGTLNLSNRIVMAPMTRSFSPNGIPDLRVAEYYRRRAADGAGLILSEGTGVNRAGSLSDPNVPKLHGDESLKGWSKVIEAVHKEKGLMGPQLWHVGSVPDYKSTWEQADIESPSGLVAPDKARGRLMTDADISDTIAAFAQAAMNAKKLGFDLVEIHGAHGYLLDQFFWSATNKRTDRFGGSTLKDRSTFAAELVSAIRAAVGPDFPISFRISQWKLQDYGVKLAKSPNEIADWLCPLVEKGVDILHCSQRRFWEAEFPEIDGQNGLNLAGWAKKVTGAATISVGSVGLDSDFISSFSGESSAPSDLRRLTERMERGEFDLIAVGRALLSDPNWVSKIRDNKLEELCAFTPSALAELV